MSNPWLIPNSPWKDEKAYLTWLRGSVRRIWSTHPVKVSYKQSRRYKAPVGRNGKEVWVSDCEMCGKACRDNQCDHVKGGFGFTDWESFCEWAKMILWVTFDDIRELCPDCHGTVTLSQRLGISFDEAAIEKQAIAICKQKADVVKSWIRERGEIPCATAAQRRLQVVEILKREKEDN